MATHDTAYRDAIAQLTGPGAPFEIETVDGLRRYRNAPKTLREALDAGRAHGEAEFAIYEGERWSFNRLFAEADAASAALAAHGVVAGDRVAIAMRNYPEWMAAFIAIANLGAVIVPLNSWGTAGDIAFGLEDSGAGLVICDQSRFDAVAGRAPALAGSAVIARPADPDHPQSWATFIASFAGAPAPQIEIAGGDPALIMYTSGTSGKPKGAVSSGDAVCQAVFNMECAAIASAMCNGEKISAMLERGHPPASLLGIPLFHNSGCHSQFLLNLRGGRRLVMMYKWDPERALELIEQERITTIAAAPAMLIGLLEHPDFDRRDTSSLFALGVGGAATPPLLRRLVAEKLPGNYCGTGWGMTETNAQGVSITGDLFYEKVGSSGRAHPIVDIEVRNDAGKSLPAGETGELWLRTPTTILEYWNRPEANASDFADGWYRTGDVGYLDEDGYLYLADRAKDMIIRGGENIYPVEIEHAFLELGAVAEAAVVGIPDERMGENVAAVIRLHDGETMSEDELTAYARGKLAGYKVPSRIVLRHEPLPRNATDKVLKQALREELLADLAS
jgi:acyl-CoA synthetase (AMP-forming)/AMP-acid ligase II